MISKLSKTDNNLDYDLAIVGGGMVGAALALAAAQQNFKVLLLERQQPILTWASDTHDLRVSALTRASQYFFQNLQLWPEMQKHGVTPYDAMHVWDQKGFGEIHFSAADLGEPDLGHIVENRNIVSALWNVIQQHENVSIQIGKNLEAIASLDQGIELQFEEGDNVKATLLVGADGAGSKVRELCHIGSTGLDYNQRGVVARVKAASGNQGTAWQHFLPEGPLALLPMEKDFFSIVWSCSPAKAEALLAMSEDEFNRQLTLESESCCGDLSLHGVRAVFPLKMQRAASYIQPSVALVGDAAHVIHPLAGQGVNLGLLDVGALLDTMIEARDKQQNLGDLGVLRRYERARKGHNLAVQTAMTAFKQLFSNQNPALHLIRNLGLGLADKLPPLRRQFERIALGQGLELPSLFKDNRDR